MAREDTQIIPVFKVYIKVTGQAKLRFSSRKKHFIPQRNKVGRGKNLAADLKLAAAVVSKRRNDCEVNTVFESTSRFFEAEVVECIPRWLFRKGKKIIISQQPLSVISCEVRSDDQSYFVVQGTRYAIFENIDGHHFLPQCLNISPNRVISTYE